MADAAALPKSADEDLQRFRDWCVKLVRKILVVFLPISFVFATFVANEGISLKIWTLVAAVFIPLFFSPLPSSLSVSLALLSYLVIIPATAFEFPGTSAFVGFKPPILPIYAAVFGGLPFSAFYAFSVAVIYCTFTYLCSTGTLVPVATPPFGAPVSQWLFSSLLHSFLYVASFVVPFCFVRRLTAT